MSDSSGLVDFAIGPVNSVINLPDRQVKVFEEFKLQKNCEINLLIKTLWGLAEMMLGLVNVSFSLPKWQAVKLTFFAPCIMFFSRNQKYSCTNWFNTQSNHHSIALLTTYPQHQNHKVFQSNLYSLELLLSEPLP